MKDSEKLCGLLERVIKFMINNVMFGGKRKVADI